MNVRRATEVDEAALRELWQEFAVEVPEPPGFEPDTWEQDWASLRTNMGSAAVFIAEDAEGAVGFAEASVAEPQRWHLETVHVRPRARRQGVTKALLRECVREAREHGVDYITLEVLTSNAAACTVWQRLGFEVIELLMSQPIEALERRLEIEA